MFSATLVRPSGRRDPPTTSWPPPFAFDFYVSTTGGGAGHTGSIGDPWSLSFAISGAGGALTAGKRVAIRGGTYDAGVGAWDVTVSGVVGSSVDAIDGKIVFRNYPGESVVIRNSAAGASDVLKVDCDYVWFWGLEIYDNGWTSRNIATQTNGCVDLGNLHGNGVKLIHCVIHDGEQCIENITGAINSDKFELYGCILYNAGVDVSPLGHNFYVHHTGSSTAKFVAECNVVFSSFGLLGQFYGNTDHVDWFDILSNIWFNGGALSFSNPYGSQMVLVGGGGQPPTNIRYLSNMLFGSDSNGRTLEIGFSAGSINNFEAGFNYHVGGGHSADSFSVNRPVVPESSLNVHDNFWKVADVNSIIGTWPDINPVTYTWSNNEWHHISTSGFGGTTWAAWKTATSLGGTDTQSDTAPATTKVFVVPATRYEPNRGIVCYFNWGSLSSIPVDLSSILGIGNSYSVYDVRDLVNPVISGTYSGGTVNFPTTQKTDPTPIGGFVGGQTPAATAPFFNAFMVVRTG